MRWVKPFLAGFVSVLVFHQGMLALLHATGRTPRRPFDLTPTSPLGVPQVVSSAFWGGLWGIALWSLIRARRGTSSYWTIALAFGALVVSAVALFIVFPLKGQPVAGGWDPALLVGAALLNGAWGLGVAALMTILAPARSRR